MINARSISAFALAVMFAAPPAVADHGQTMPGGHMEHQAHGAAIEIPPGPDAPKVEITVAKDAVGGWNLNIRAANFRFAPDHASLPHIAGEGHAHLYANGRKIARIYGPWFHIETLPAGDVELRVDLNANDHRPFSVSGHTVRATATVHNAGHTH